MKVKNRLGTICSLTILLTSCDCVVQHQGYVRDSMTERPIENAIVKFDKREYKTDSVGYFEIYYITGFCPDWDFQIEKENYRTENILIELDDNEVIYRVRESTKDNEGKELENSVNFKVKNDTIHFLLTRTNY